MEIWLGIVNGQISSIFGLSARDTSEFHLRLINSKYQWIFTKLHVCIGIVVTWFVTGKFRQVLTQLSACYTSVFSFLDDNFLVNINGFSPNLVYALILWRSALGLLMGKFRLYLTVICPQYTHILFSGQ